MIVIDVEESDVSNDSIKRIVYHVTSRIFKMSSCSGVCWLE